jgi:magnesium and cobalt transporter
MQDEQNANGSHHRSWMDRLSQAFSGEPQDIGELIETLRDAQRRGLLDVDDLAMMEGVLQVSELRVRDVMIPRAMMVTVRQTQGPEEFVPQVIESRHSRFPVVSEDGRRVVGILLAKDLLAYCCQQGTRKFKMDAVLRPAVVIPDSKRLDVLLREFQKKRNHMAIVVDEYGDFSGLLTIEDVLEQIVGEIADETDLDDETYILSKGEGRYSVKALTPIDELNRFFSSQFSEEEFDTIGGLVTHRFGHVARRGERIMIGGLQFEVLRSDSRRIHLLGVTDLRVEGQGDDVPDWRSHR